VPGGERPPGRGPRRLGLDASRRLRQRAEFERLLREGSRRSFEGYTFYLRRREAGGPRLGMLVSKKHAALAVERNRLKRCIREAFRLEQERLGALDVLVRPPYGAKPSPRMIAMLRQLFTRLEQ
jgi:ribonuclease P protein component